MEYIQQSDEWLAMRRDKIGSSDAPVIMGISPWKTVYQLWEEKVGIGEEQEMKPWMRRGLDMEEAARAKFEEVTRSIVFPRVVFSEDHEFMVASLDGIDIEEKIAVEIKCPGQIDHQKALDGEVPEKYIPQLQHQLEVTGLDMMYYFSYTYDSYAIIEVPRDDAYIQVLLAKEYHFWKCVKNLTSPTLSEKDVIERSDDMWLHAAKEWANCNEQMNALKQKEEELREMLICLAGKRNSYGGGVKVTRSLRKGAVDYSSIPELRDVNLDLYRKGSSESWKITKT